MTPSTTTTPPRWAPAPCPHRIRFLCQRYALSEPAARLLAPMVFGEVRQ
ncbi:hypothetical protein Rumeso_03437 [Rubellimicrobium mesophilum DSM 19309]|uniref:Uncharacterized protein n=1 Tax=Rubellimicrobium mesophilum DSM 19309 TaxID=442562 RepID=A0A017HLI1_9RHOB|nr:hypothetical protein [Rubellimicrobium mesophilum]EYD75013.1 hypothetical protein Rumeso_03437 [Rubellimicrobium mesophilum DSM 19309]